MGIRTEQWRPGTPCWTELAVEDVEEAKAFYGPLLGWSFERSTGQRDLILATAHGVAAAGISTPAEDPAHDRSHHRSQDRPAGWLTFLATADVQASVEAVLAHGGQVLSPPRAAGTRGVRAVACDPTGAVFGLWQARDAIGAAHVEAPGCFAWTDLRTTDPEAAREFYAKVFGLTGDRLPARFGADESYQVLGFPDDRRPVGGIGPIGDAEDGAPFWLVYFQVRGLRAAVDFVESTGGLVERRSLDTPFGRMAAVRDPLGSRFWLVQAAEQRPTLTPG